MTPERFKLIKNIVADALDLPSEEQASFIAKKCGTDNSLFEEVQSLIASEINQNFLNLSPTESVTTENTHPKQIGRIKIQQLLASGGMGKVYVGMDELLKRKVAVKVMHTDQQLSAQQRAAFLHEAQALSSLQHPNICQIHDFFSEYIDGHQHDVLVLEYIDGKTLSQILSEQTPKQSPLEQPLFVALKILLALTTAHERGIVHRDLKPDNIMITDKGEVKILDFGLAKSESHVVIDVNAPTEVTQIAGTPGYMSPEQAKGIRTAAATDIWSFGLLLCELLTGKRPYPKAATTQELLKRARHAEFNVPQSLPSDQQRLVHHLLQTKPEDRPSARTALDSIKRIIDKPKRRLKILTIGLIATVALLSGWKYTFDLNHERNTAINARNQAEALVDYMLDDLYTGLRAVGRTDLLESAANQALLYYGNLSDEQMQLTMGKPATALLQIAEVFSDRGNKEQAIQTLNLAIDKLNTLNNKQPDNELIKSRLADAYISAADILRIAGELELTKEYSRIASQIGEQLTTGLSPGVGPIDAPDGTARWRILLRAVYLNADGHMRLGERTKAIELLETVVMPAKAAAQINPKLLINLSDIQFKRCGTFYDANMIGKMLEPCLNVFEIDQGLYESEPENYQNQKNLVGDYAVMANVYRKLGQLDQALKYAQAGIDLGENLIIWDAENDNTLNEFVTVLLALGRVQRDLGLPTESEETFERALKIIEPIAADQEEISYMNSHFTALIFLDKIDEARQIAKTLHTRNFMRRDFQDLCTEFQIEACGIDKLIKNKP